MHEAVQRDIRHIAFKDTELESGKRRLTAIHPTSGSVFMQYTGNQKTLMADPTPHPQGYSLRPAALSDLEAVVQLITRRNLVDFGEPLVSAESMLAAWQAPGFDLSQDAWVVQGAPGELAAYAGLTQEGDTYSLSLHIADEPTGQEIGRLLLERAESRAESIAALAATSAAPGEASPRLVCRAGGKNPGLCRRLEDAGYRLGLTFHIMQIDLAAPPQAPRWPAGIAAHPFRPGQDDRAAYQADEDASQDKGYHQPLSFEAWAKRMSLYEGLFDPRLWFLAWDGREIAGLALNFLSPGRETGWVDHLGVRQPWRKRGLGLALLLHSFGEFYRIGASRVKLSVDSASLTNAPRLYARAGMRTVQQYHIYSKTITRMSE